MKIKILFILLFVNIQCALAQNTVDKKFYLLDDLVLDELTENGMEKLDSLLIIFHQPKNNSSIANLLYDLKEINNTSIEEKYLYHFVAYYKNLIANTSETKLLKAYSSIYVKILAELGDLLSYSDDIDGAIFYWEEALQICYEQDFESSRISRLLSELALLYSYMGVHSKATNYSLEALKIDEENNDQEKLPASYGTLAYAFAVNEAHDMALPYATKALNLNTKNENEPGMVDNYNLLSLIFEGKNDLDSSLYYGQKGLKLALEIDDEFSAAISYEAIGSVLLKDKQFTKALFNYSSSYAITNSLGLSGYSSSCLLGMGRSNAGLGNYNEAKKHLTKAYNTGLESGDLQLCFFSSQELGELNATHKNWEEATKYYEISAPLLDSLHNSRNIEEIASNAMEYEYEKKKNIDNKKNEIALELEKAAQKKWELILYISLFAFLLIITIVIISYKKINTKNNNLEKLLNRNNILTKELHHRVKNNLEVISSLLNLQSRNINDPKAFAAIREGENRVNSIALMHQKLYQTDTISEVDFKHYTKELVAHLKTVFTQPGQNITIDISTIIIDYF